MDHIKKAEAQTHSFFDGAVSVNEYNFQDTSLNDADIVITGRYPLEGYAINDVSTALVSVESGSGSIDIIGSDAQNLEVGDRLLIKAGDAYAFTAFGKLALRYIATPAWTADQARIVEG